MPISVTCPACSHCLTVKDEYAGRKGKCPKCQATVQIPRQAGPATAVSPSGGKRLAAATTETVTVAHTSTEVAPLKPRFQPAPAAAPKPQSVLSRDEVRAQLAAAFQGTLQPPPVSLLRKVGLLLVAAIVLLLPLFYVVAVGLLIAGLYSVGTTDVVPAGALRYAALAAGLLVLICLLKPLFAPRRRSVRSYPVDSQEEPALHELIDRVCQQLNTPRPKSVRLECSAYCGARYRRGLLGYLTGDLGLTIGLPLAACLSVEQLAALFAGELAPFRRHSGRALSTVINGINGWLWRSVFEPDRWDDWVARHTSRPGMHAGKLLWPLKGVRIISQIVLWIPMFIGNTVASAIARRTQHDADRCQARLAGRNDFESTQQRAAVAAFNWEGVLSDLSFLRKEGQLPDSLPKQLQLRMIDVTPELTSVLMDSVVKRTERPFDSRPSEADRLAAIAAEPGEGVMTSDLPAWNLFSNYEKLARQLTWDYYSATFGKNLVPAALKPVELPAGG